MNEVNAIKNKRDIERMKKALHGRDRLLFIFGVNSGLRISDILRLTVGDVRGKDSIDVKESKTSKTKRFAFNSAIKKAVADLVPALTPDTAPLFPSRKGDRAIGRVQAYRILNAAAERANVKGAIGTHTLRKTFGYRAYEGGTDIALLMRIFNHSQQNVTLRYIGVEQDDIDAVYTSINL